MTSTGRYLASAIAAVAQPGGLPVDIDPVGPDTWDCTVDVESLRDADRALLLHAIDTDGTVTVDGVLARALLDPAPEWVRIHASIHPLTVTIVLQVDR